MISTQLWDVIVIGGGPAGMMAAAFASERGKKVLLLEKNSILGKKLLITGGGRCNLTNYKPEPTTLINNFKDKPKALYSIFTQFGVEETIQYFNLHGMPTKIEAEGRVFPESNKAESVWQVLVNHLKTTNVTIKSNTKVTKIEKEKETITVHTKDSSYVAKSCIVATGGTSHPETGSTGDGYAWLKNLGHTIIENNYSLVPIAIKEKWVKELSGVTLQDIKITITLDGKIKESKKGKILFTHFGVSGPTVLNLSSTVRDLLQYGTVILNLDLLPHLDQAQLRTELHNTLTQDINKKIKNTLSNLIPASLVNTVIELAQIDPDKPNHSITKEERARLIKTLKEMPMSVKGLLGADKAIVSSGGVKIEEVNFQTMESKIVPGLYIIGDLLNIDRPSGGYSLQICWSSGYVAGSRC